MAFLRAYMREGGVAEKPPLFRKSHLLRTYLLY